MIKVSTGRLRDGDKITIEGATILIEGKPEITVGPNGTVWAWRNMPIVAGALRPYPGTVRWTIQGDSLTYWPVTRGSGS